MENDEQSRDEVGPLRAELAEWRRRAEMAEAVAAERLTRAAIAEAIAAERLTRAETAERALRAAEGAFQALERAGTASRPAASRPTATVARPATADAPGAGTAEQVAEPAPEDTGPRSLREWWRRYTDSIT